VLCNMKRREGGGEAGQVAVSLLREGGVPGVSLRGSLIDEGRKEVAEERNDGFLERKKEREEVFASTGRCTAFSLLPY